MLLDKIFQTKYTSWIELEKVIEKIESLKIKGDVFEQFSYFYLLYFKSVYQITEIFCPIVDGKPFPQFVSKKLKLESKDHGVDGVYITKNGEYVAWQSKFRTGNQSPTFSELSTFWTEAENASFRLIISNAYFLPKIANKKAGHISILYDHFENLEINFFEQLFKFTTSEVKNINFKRKEPRDYQDEILSDLINGFKLVNKGKLIAACGIGKTLIALWLSERLQLNSIVFFAPSLQLIRQTLQEWATESSIPFRYLCICSDQSVNSNLDTNNIDLSDIDIPVSTGKATIVQFLNSVDKKEKNVIFCTYQSSSILCAALKEKSGAIDLAIYDEAHRTAGIGQNNSFNEAVSDENFFAERKLFMTATERLIRPALAKDLEENRKVVFSMNDENIYGKVFHRLTFGQAIAKNIISDYRIAFVGVAQTQMEAILNRNYIVQNEDESNLQPESVDTLYKRVILNKVLHELDVQKVITFHSKISEAVHFADNLKIEGLDDKSYFVGHINGSMPSQRRSLLIDEFKDADLGVLTNVRCLTEGIDIPMIDAVYFADPKGSLIDIVQAVGRALRQPYGKKGKVAYIIIPLLINAEESEVLAGQGFEALYNLIQALRDQDEQLAEWIDSINIGVARGRINKQTPLGKLKINLPIDIDYEKFANSLLLKIASVNKNPTGVFGIGSKLGKNQRKGSFTRFYKTICDYTPSKLEESLIKPTFEIIDDVDKLYSSQELKINNNNISHCIRLGLLLKTNANKFSITEIGKLYVYNKVNFKTIMKNQMMLFYYKYEKGNLYPYRVAFEFMKELGEMNFVQFIYGLYSVQFNENGTIELQEAIKTAKSIKAEFPNIEITNEANKQIVLDTLNENHPVGFSFENVWTDRTTTGNQFRYLVRHLELFPEIFYWENNKLKVREDGYNAIDEILSFTKRYIVKDGYGSQWWIN